MIATTCKQRVWPFQVIAVDTQIEFVKENFHDPGFKTKFKIVMGRVSDRKNTGSLGAKFEDQQNGIHALFWKADDALLITDSF